MREPDWQSTSGLRRFVAYVVPAPCIPCRLFPSSPFNLWVLPSPPLALVLSAPFVPHSAVNAAQRRRLHPRRRETPQKVLSFTSLPNGIQNLWLFHPPPSLPPGISGPGFSQFDWRFVCVCVCWCLPCSGVPMGGYPREFVRFHASPGLKSQFHDLPWVLLNSSGKTHTHTLSFHLSIGASLLAWEKPHCHHSLAPLPIDGANCWFYFLIFYI